MFVFSPSGVSWTSRESPEEGGGFPAHRNKEVTRMSLLAVQQAFRKLGGGWGDRFHALKHSGPQFNLK